MKQPLVSVNIAVFNGEDVIADTVRSLLQQTLTDLEVVIVDDGSTDGTLALLETFDDPRIHIITQTHQGIPRSRNHALSLSSGKYIAVSDADDISLPNRLEKQVAFLESHPEIGMVGSGCRIIDEVAGREWDYRPPTEDAQIHRHLIRGNPFIHSSAMIRRDLLLEVEGYNVEFPYILDYELFARLAAITKLSNLADPLLIRRFRWGSVSTNLRTEFRRMVLRMRVRYLVLRTLDFPIYFAPFVLQPIVFTIVEMRPKLGRYMRQTVDNLRNQNVDK